MESGKIHRTNPFNGGARQKTLTMTESGLLHYAIIQRRKEAVLKRYKQMRSSKVRRMFTKDIDKTIQKMTGRTIAKVVHSMWNKGYFDRFEEFQASNSKNQNQQHPEAEAA